MANRQNPSTGSPQPDKGSGTPRDYLHDPLQLGLTIVGTTVLLGLGGWWLDRKIGTFPILMVLMAAVGLFGIIYSVSARLRQQDSETHRAGKGDRADRL